MISVLELWSNLHSNGWKLSEIDNMDIVFYFRMMRYTNKEQIDKVTPIDQIGFL